MTGKYRCYFPGGNTPEGFVSYYGDIMPQKDAGRIFCIKGGPGTGKSTLMREIGEEYLLKSIDVDFLKCSSDPASLDGIVIKDKRIAVIDGTTPHITDPVNPGAVDEIIDLEKCLDNEKLMRNKNQIVSLNIDIGETFEYAYTYLKCAGTLYHYIDRILKKYIYEEKLYDFIISLDLPKKRKNRGRKQKLFGSSITSSGIVNELLSMTKEVNNVYLIKMPSSYKYENFMSVLSQTLMDRGYDTEELYCPMYPSETAEHIISKEADIAIITCNNYHGKELLKENNVKDIINVNISPFNKNDRLKLEELEKAADMNIKVAIDILKNAKKKHDELETYYIEAMDFDKVQEIKNEVVGKIEQSTV